MKQKDIFLKFEGDKWLQRNRKTIEARKLPDDDPVLMEILYLKRFANIQWGTLSLLEIGCSYGYRLKWIQENLGWVCKGIEPSKEAVLMANNMGLDVIQGTADRLPYPDFTFDILIFGFCLYLCDREDLFRIAYEG